MTENYLDGIEPGTVIYAGPDDQETINGAKEFVSEKQIDKELVKLMRLEVELENKTTAKIIALVVR